MQPFASVAVTVIGKLPVCVGVPDSVAVPVLTVIPVGSVPVSAHVMAPLPPLCVNSCEYGLPAVPAGIVAGSTVIVWQLMTSVTARVPKQPFASVARTVIGKLPVCVGVPESTPVAVLKLRPVGSVPVSDHVMVPTPPDCVKVCEYAVPTVPAGIVAGSTVMVGQLITSV